MSLKAGVLGTLNQEDPEFKTLLSYKRPCLRKEREEEWVGREGKGGRAGRKGRRGI